MKTDKQILGYSRYWVLVAAFFSMAIISPYEYAWSSISVVLGPAFKYSHLMIGIMFTLFVVFESVGTLPGGILRDKIGPRKLTMIGGIVAAIGILSLSFGTYVPTLIIYSIIGSFAAGFVYNDAVNTANKWFPDKRGVTAGLIAAGFSWGSLPFVFVIRGIPRVAGISAFIHFIYIMAIIIAVISLITGFFMRDPPKDWKPPGWTPKVKAIKRPSTHQFTLTEAMKTWQLWLLVVSFILISGSGLAIVAKSVAFSKSFGFTAVVATATAGGLAVTNGLGRIGLGALSEKFGRENSMILSYVLSGIFTSVAVFAGLAGNEAVFVVAVVLGIFFWGPLFSLFPTIIGHYYGENAAGANYGILYAIAKGSGGIYGGVLSAALITSLGYADTFYVAAVMAILAGLIIIPLKFRPPVWKKENIDKSGTSVI